MEMRGRPGSQIVRPDAVGSAAVSFIPFATFARLSRVSAALLRPGFVLLLALLLCSCATFARREGVQISLVNLALGEATVWETELRLTVRIQNELPEALVVDGAVHKVYLNGTYIGEGLSNERLEIPRLSTATQNVTVYLRNISMLTKLRGIIDSQAVDYRMTSLLYTESQGRYRAERTARLDFKDLQPAPAP